MSAPATISETVNDAAQALLAHSDSPRLDAELLLSAVLRLPRSALIAHGEDAIATNHQVAYWQLVDKRAEGTPFAYLVGVREFWSLPLSVGPGVLVPRPETECLVEQALTLVPGDEDCSVLDLGTGSGAIALALAREHPAWAITGVDISAEALKIAARNSFMLELARIRWRQGDWFDAVPGERFRLIVSNPPYIAGADPALAKLTAEPLQALTPGPTGLEALAAIIERAPAHLHPNGWLALEHGITQAQDVAQLMQQHRFDSIRTFPDLSGRPRVTLGRSHT